MRLGSVFKMRISILNTATTEQMGYGIISFFYVLAPEGMNSIVFGEINGDMSEVYYLLGRYTIQKKRMIYCHNIIVNLSYTMIAGDIIISA